MAWVLVVYDYFVYVVHRIDCDCVGFRTDGVFEFSESFEGDIRTIWLDGCFKLFFVDGNEAVFINDKSDFAKRFFSPF